MRGWQKKDLMSLVMVARHVMVAMARMLWNLQRRETVFEIF